jgi:hypothetical protein
MINRTIATVIQLLILALLNTTFSSLAQTTESRFADSIVIYKGLFSGGSTANLRYLSSAVDTMKNVTKEFLPKEYLDSLNFKIKQVKVKRHLQQKVGPSYYAVLYLDGKKHRIAIVPHFAITDLNNSRQYIFNKDLNEFIDRLIKKNYH